MIISYFFLPSGGERHRRCDDDETRLGIRVFEARPWLHRLSVCQRHGERSRIQTLRDKGKGEGEGLVELSLVGWRIRCLDRRWVRIITVKD